MNKGLDTLINLPFEEGVDGVRFGENYLYATRGGEGSFAPCFSVKEVLSMQAQGEIVNVTISDLELNEAGEIKYLFGYYKEG